MLKTIVVGLTILLSSSSFAAEVSTNTLYSIRPMSELQFVPSKVWSDGAFTYIEMSPDYRGRMPIISRIDEGGAQIVNYVEVSDGLQRHLKVCGVLQHASLRLQDQLVLLDQSVTGH